MKRSSALPDLPDLNLESKSRELFLAVRDNHEWTTPAWDELTDKQREFYRALARRIL